MKKLTKSQREALAATQGRARRQPRQPIAGSVQQLTYKVVENHNGEAGPGNYWDILVDGELAGDLCLTDGDENYAVWEARVDLGHGRKAAGLADWYENDGPYDDLRVRQEAVEGALDKAARMGRQASRALPASADPAADLFKRHGGESTRAAEAECKLLAAPYIWHNRWVDKIQSKERVEQAYCGCGAPSVRIGSGGSRGMIGWCQVGKSEKNPPYHAISRTIGNKELLKNAAAKAANRPGDLVTR